MHLIRFRSPHGTSACAVLVDGVGYHVDATSISELLALRADQMAEAVHDAARRARPALVAADALMAPIDGLTEVWAAGVTYRRSRDARQEESERAADVYAMVYEASRPEVFFKSVAWRVRGHGQTIAVRHDSVVNVPEPELALVVNSHREIVGYTVCNDVSSRSIEGENPLYLPQAKIYAGSCAIGPSIALATGGPDPTRLDLHCMIHRHGEVAWSASASTSEIVRPFGELVDYCTRSLEFPGGLVLSTGTCLVPDLPFSLQPGDLVSVQIDGIGRLDNPVVSDLALMGHR